MLHLLRVVLIALTAYVVRDILLPILIIGIHTIGDLDDLQREVDYIAKMKM